MLFVEQASNPVIEEELKVELIEVKSEWQGVPLPL
jgi:hypothetical protein